MSEEREMAFRDTRFLVTLLSEDTKSYYTTRVLELQNMNVGLRIVRDTGRGFPLNDGKAELNVWFIVFVTFRHILGFCLVQFPFVFVFPWNRAV